jgi:hypothetical protein
MPRHFQICLGLGLLIIPIFFFDRYFLKPGGGTGWISLNLRGIIFWPYLIFVLVHVCVSTLWFYIFQTHSLVRIHLGSGVLSIVIIILYAFLHFGYQDYSARQRRVTKMESRKRFVNALALNSWYIDGVEPGQIIHLSVTVNERGRFAANASGYQKNGDDELMIFQSGRVEQQRVKAGDTVNYVMPLEAVNAGDANEISITLYLFKDEDGSAPYNIFKVYEGEVRVEDDGEYYYGLLPAPSQHLQGGSVQ